jgi:hypothetical protein
MKSQTQLSRNTGGTSPIKQGFSAPESPTIAMIFWDFAPASRRLFSRFDPNVSTKAPHVFPALSPHTSRWASYSFVLHSYLNKRISLQGVLHETF